MKKVLVLILMLCMVFAFNTVALAEGVIFENEDIIIIEENQEQNTSTIDDIILYGSPVEYYGINFYLTEVDGWPNYYNLDFFCTANPIPGETLTLHPILSSTSALSSWEGYDEWKFYDFDYLSNSLEDNIFNRLYIPPTENQLRLRVTGGITLSNGKYCSISKSKILDRGDDF